MTDDAYKSYLKKFSEKFLPALLALVVATTSLVVGKNDIAESNENRVASEIMLNNRVTQLELQAAEMKGEQKSQRELLTELRLDIREIKTLLEQNFSEKKR